MDKIIKTDINMGNKIEFSASRHLTVTIEDSTGSSFTIGNDSYGCESESRQFLKIEGDGSMELTLIEAKAFLRHIQLIIDMMEENELDISDDRY